LLDEFGKPNRREDKKRSRPKENGCGIKKYCNSLYHEILKLSTKGEKL
jgi:hypothetical protein